MPPAVQACPAVAPCAASSAAASEPRPAHGHRHRHLLRLGRKDRQERFVRAADACLAERRQALLARRIRSMIGFAPTQCRTQNRALSS
jgi:hypothetical protein